MNSPAAGADVVVKLDGDGQMDPAMIPQLVAPILQGQADYVKGNRFYNLEDVRTMPWTRLIGNATLSFITKLSSGYWKLFDPTNGYTAISAAILPYIRWHKVKRRYFFESDLLFHLGIINATVLDLPMTAIYANEKSGMTVLKVFRPFLAGNLGNLFRRVFYSYFLRDFSLASLELVMGVVLLVFGLAFGTWGWATSIATERPATTGTVMLASLPVILGFQMLQSFLAFDIAATPNRVITPLLPPKCMSGEVLARVRFQARCGEVS